MKNSVSLILVVVLLGSLFVAGCSDTAWEAPQYRDKDLIVAFADSYPEIISMAYKNDQNLENEARMQYDKINQIVPISPGLNTTKQNYLMALESFENSGKLSSDALEARNRGDSSTANKLAGEANLMKDTGLFYLQPVVFSLNIPYDSVFRYNERYVGDTVFFSGFVSQVQNLGGGTYALRVATKDKYDDVIWVNYQGFRVLEDDMVVLYGTVKGLKEYRSVLGESITIPEIDAFYLKVTNQESQFRTHYYLTGKIKT